MENREFRAGFEPWRGTWLPPSQQRLPAFVPERLDEGSQAITAWDPFKKDTVPAGRYDLYPELLHRSAFNDTAIRPNHTVPLGRVVFLTLPRQ
jgi:hypothetical protein